MNTKKQKGFTLVELVIVIAVIAILAAVLIPTFSSLVKKANLSADEQAVKQMNTALAIYTAENDKPSTVIEVKKALDENLINTESMVPVTKGYAFYWNPAENKIVLVGDGKGTATDDWYILTSKEYGTETKATKLDDITTAISNSSNAEPALIKVNSNIETEKITISDGKSVIVDLQGQTISSNAASKGTNENDFETIGVFRVETGGTLTIKNGTISAKWDAVYNDGGDVTLESVKITTSESNETAIYAANISNTVIKECEINATYIGVGSNATANSGARIVITDTKINAGNTGIYIPLNSNLTIDNCDITGKYFGIYLRGCSANISNTTVKHTEKPGTGRWNSGPSAPVLADIVFACGGGFGGGYTKDSNQPISFEDYTLTGTYKCENVTLEGKTDTGEYNVVIHEPVGGNVSVSGINVDIEYNESNNFNLTTGNN